MTRKTWQQTGMAGRQEQKAGWSHCIHIQEAESSKYWLAYFLPFSTVQGSGDKSPYNNSCSQETPPPQACPETHLLGDCRFRSQF